ncbi:MAG: hypothetical protein MZU97_03310 [Bacillus subtilis]|nr:hypothetical protein [Bacillus subtilis]
MIRPTVVEMTPDRVRDYLSRDEHALYALGSGKDSSLLDEGSPVRRDHSDHRCRAL